MELRAILHFIVHQASEAEIASILAALDARIKDGSRDYTVDFRRLAGKALQGFAEKFQPVDPNGMTRRLVASMIKGTEPGISDTDLQVLLNTWVPSAEQTESVEKSIPVPMLFTMIQQFVHYSTGAMGATEEKELRASIPDWPARYWEQFSAETRELISSFLQGRVSQEEFWRSIGFRLTGKHF